MTIKDMEYMIAIADENSVTRAAQKLYISQPALSQKLSKVEKETESTIFERKPSGGIEITAPGKVFIENAREIVAQYYGCLKKMKQKKTPKSIAIGFPTRQATILCPNIFEILSEHYPDLTVKVVDSSNANLEKMVASQEIDMAFIRMAMPSDKYVKKTLASDEPYVILRKNSPLCAERELLKDGTLFLDIKKLGNEPFITTCEGQRTRAMFDLIMKKAGIEPNIVKEAPNIEFFKYYLREGIASAILPSVPNNGEICRIEEKYRVSYTLDLVYGSHMDPEWMEELYRLLKPTMISSYSYSI